MIWFSIWAVLVIGACVSTFFLFSMLFRKGLGIVEELSASGDTAAKLSEAMSDAERFPGAQVTPAAIGQSPEQARVRWDQLRDRAAARKEVRLKQHGVTYSRWSVIGGRRDGDLKLRWGSPRAKARQAR